jgi:hypothetical protein
MPGHIVHLLATRDSLRARRRLPQCTPRRIKCMHARWKDDQPLHDLACATDTCSQHRRGQTIQGTRRPTRDGDCPNDSRRLVPPRACDRTLRRLSSKQSHSVGVARTRPCCRSKDRANVICEHRIQAHSLPGVLLQSQAGQHARHLAALSCGRVGEGEAGRGRGRGSYGRLTDRQSATSQIG